MKETFMKKITNGIIASGIYLLGLIFVHSRLVNKEIDFTTYKSLWKVIGKGWLNTIAISITSILLALIIGLVLYMMSKSRFGVLRYLAAIHKNIIFGSPLVVLAIVGYYYIADAFNIDSNFLAGVLVLGLYIAAYIADIYNAAITGIHVNQWQTAKMFGFNKVQTYRYIIFPQVMRSILPPLAGQFALTIKGSALLAYMGMSEFLNSIQTVQAATFGYTEGYIIVLIGYLCITLPLIQLIRYYEQQLNYSKVQS